MVIRTLIHHGVCHTDTRLIIIQAGIIHIIITVHTHIIITGITAPGGIHTTIIIIRITTEGTTVAVTTIRKMKLMVADIRQVLIQEHKDVLHQFHREVLRQGLRYIQLRVQPGVLPL